MISSKFEVREVRTPTACDSAPHCLINSSWMNGLSLSRSKISLLAIGVWLLISSLQTVHFYYYFEQTLWNSVRWSFRDWFVWFAIFALIYRFVSPRMNLEKLGLKSVAAIAVIGICSGMLQILTIVSIDFIQGTATRPFWEDFWRFYNKRWFQYLFVFVGFWLLMSHCRAKNASARVNSTSIKVDDGKQTHWLKTEDITALEAAGNYVCIHQGAEQLIVRATIKAFQAKLDSEKFMRVSRSNIVNMGAVVSCKRAGQSKLELHMANGMVVSVGPTYKPAVKAKLHLS